jgi:hypothetical protein
MSKLVRQLSHVCIHARDPSGSRIELFEYTSKSAQFVGGDRVADW